MQILYYLLLFFVAVSVVIAILMATGVLNISVHKGSDMDDLPEDIRKLLDDNDDEKKE